MSDAALPGPASAVSPVSGGRRLLTTREKLLLGGTVFALVGMFFLWPAEKAPPPREREVPMPEAGRSLPYRPLADAVAEQATPAVATQALVPAAGGLPMPGTAGAGGGGGGVRPAPSPIMSYEDRAPTRTHEPADASNPRGRSAEAAGETRADDALSARLRPSRMAAARATVLRNPELTVPMGARIPCLPEMPIDSTVAGFFSCVVPVAVRGSTGTVILMERGTRIVGEVRSGLARGSRRLFVVMTHALTPDGVEIELNSPGADVMGQAGLDGEVDSHFFERFRGAMLLAFLDTGLQAAALAASNALSSERGVTFNQFQTGGRQASSAAVEADVNIPSTLRRNQAEPMTVFVARNLDFSGVYSLRVRR